MTTIETWNPVVGCSRVSAGCDHCGDLRDVMLTDRKGGDWNEWPADLRVREVPA